MSEIFNNDSFVGPELNQQHSEEESPISKKLKSKDDGERLEALKVKEKQEAMEKEMSYKNKCTKK